MASNKEIIEVKKIFYDFLDGNLNSPFLRLEYSDDNKYVKHKINKAVVMRGSIRYLEEKVLRVLKTNDAVDKQSKQEKKNE